MPNDLDLNSTLRDLPRVGARPDFTTQVLAKLQQRQAAAVSPSAWQPLVAAAAVFAMVALVANWQRPGDRLPHGTLSISSIAAEHQQLAKEFDSLRALSQSARPVLHVDGNDQVDFVLGLNEISQLPRQRRTDMATPVNFPAATDTY